MGKQARISRSKLIPMPPKEIGRGGRGGFSASVGYRSLAAKPTGIKNQTIMAGKSGMRAVVADSVPRAARKS